MELPLPVALPLPLAVAVPDAEVEATAGAAGDSTVKFNIDTLTETCLRILTAVWLDFEVGAVCEDLSSVGRVHEHNLVAGTR